MADLISVIVTTWNREDALDAVLRSLAVQTDRDFEVIVADDGSGEATARLIAEWKPKLRRPLKHVWQEHRGFRAARNPQSRYPRERRCLLYLPRRRLYRSVGLCRDASQSFRREGWFVTGNRILMSEQLTATILREKLDPETWSYREWAKERGRGGINRTVPLVRLPLGPLRKLRWRAWRGARSCNLGIWRSDLDRVDGFDCAYQGWGRRRFRLAGPASPCRHSAQGWCLRNRRICIYGIRRRTARGCRIMTRSLKTSERVGRSQHAQGLSAMSDVGEEVPSDDKSRERPPRGHEDRRVH